MQWSPILFEIAALACCVAVILSVVPYFLGPHRAPPIPTLPQQREAALEMLRTCNPDHGPVLEVGSGFLPVTMGLPLKTPLHWQELAWPAYLVSWVFGQTRKLCGGRVIVTRQDSLKADWNADVLFVYQSYDFNQRMLEEVKDCLHPPKWVCTVGFPLNLPASRQVELKTGSVYLYKISGFAQ